MLLGYSCLVFALVAYITNFKDINKELVWRWKDAIKQTRITYYEMNYPYGYYFFSQHKRNVQFTNKNFVKQQYYLDTLYNRKMMER